MLIRCKSCCMPNTRPDTAWVDGECSACINYRNRQNIDWAVRKEELIALLDRHDGRCLVPSSGGKDSSYQVHTLLELGADVTVVTARTCHLTEIGRRNIDNLARYARTIEVVPNMTVRAKLNRLGLELVGDISWAEHCAIFTTPFNVSAELNIPLVFYGENPQNQYGGPLGSEEAKTMTRRWRSEFGGFLGLRPSDFVNMDGIRTQDMNDYCIHYIDYPTEVHFLGAYLPWDSYQNTSVAFDKGMQIQKPSYANWWNSENLDNAQTGIHDFFMFLKYGFGRGCQQISVDVRAGRESREGALEWVETYDGWFPSIYAGVKLQEVLDHIGMKRERFFELCEQFKDMRVHP